MPDRRQCDIGTLFPAHPPIPSTTISFVKNHPSLSHSTLSLCPARRSTLAQVSGKNPNTTFQRYVLFFNVKFVTTVIDWSNQSIRLFRSKFVATVIDSLINRLARSSQAHLFTASVTRKLAQRKSNTLGPFSLLQALHPISGPFSPIQVPSAPHSSPFSPSRPLQPLSSHFTLV